MISKSFYKSSLIYSVVGSLPYISGFILLPVFIRYLSQEQVGLNALYFTIIYFVQVFSTYGLDSYIGISYFDYKNDKQKLREHIGSILVLLFVLGVFIISVILICGNRIFALISKDDALSLYPFGLMTVATGIFTGFLRTYSGLLINQQRPVRFFWINIINFCLTIGVTILFLYLYPHTLNGPIWGRLIPVTFSFCLVLYFMLSEFGIIFKKEFLSGIVSFCTPMVIYALFIWVVSYIDRFIINNVMNSAKYVAVFDFGVKLTLVIDFFQTGLANTIHPKIYNIWKDNDLRESTPEVNRYYHGFTAISLLVIPIFIVVTPLLVPIIIHKEEYFMCFPFLGILCMGYATRGLFNLFLAPIFFFKQTRVLPKIFFFSAIFQILISYLFIKNFNLVGAIWATFFIRPIQVVLLYIESRKIFKFRFNKTKLIYLPLSYIIMIVSSIVFLRQFNVVLIGSLQFVMTVLLIYLIYRSELKVILTPFLRVLGMK